MTQKFTTPCFVRKNTPKLRKKLEELGYSQSSIDDNKGLYLWTDEHGLYYTSRNHLSQEYGEYIGPYGIFCKDDEYLFLALAALRDDSDYMQWFTNGTEFILCDKKSWLDGKIPDLIHKRDLSIAVVEMLYNYHKATVEELIEHFK